ncbi:LPD38 domain-containing protein [Prevotella sp. Sow4_E9_plate]|uniref:LPD38 domain-containing protein n=1 Tax=Prevotella sp. Sow4_E9_plate TaxID=3438802 RepID=UPI003F9C099B
MPDNILKYIFRDKSGAKHTVWKSDYDADPQGFAKAYPDARFEVVNRKTGDRGHVSVKDVGAAQKEGFNLFTMKAYQKEHYEKPKTIKQRAQEVAAQYQKGKQTKQPVDYLHRPQSQMGRPLRNVPAKASPFVRSLYEIDNAQKGPDYSVDYTSPKATQQVYQQNQHVRRQAAQTASDHIANDEYRRQSQPMIDNGTVGVMKPMGEIEQEMSDSASRFVDANLGDYINNAVLGEQNAAAQRGLDAANRVPLQAGAGGGMGLMVKGMAYNKEVDPDAMTKNLTDNARNGFLKLFQNPSFVAKLDNEAARLGVTPEAYIESIIPHLKDRLAATLQQSEYQKALPKNMLDNVANRFIDSNLTGQLLRLATQTRGQRVMHERASAATAAGENPYYKGSTVENVVADVAGMVSDPVFKGAAGAGGKVAGKLIGNSTKLSALMANGNLAQRLMAKGAQVVTSGGVTGFVFDSTGSVIQNYSTGEDTSLGNTLKVAVKGGTTGAVNFATMSLAGIPLSEVGRSIGLKAVKGGSFWGNTGRATAKIGLESGKTYMEAMGMYLGGYVSGKLEGRTDANGKPIEFDLWNGTMESLPTAIGFRLQHAIGGLKGGRKNEKGEDMGWFGSTIANFKDFVTSDKAKESRFLMTEDERNQIFSSGAMNGLMPDGENIVSYAKRTKNKKVSYDDPYLETDASMIKNTYDQIMADPKVSWDAKAKFSAMVTGIMPSARPMMDYITYSSEDYVKDGLLRGKRKYVNEYSAKGELLSKIPYDSKVDRDNVVYKHNIVRENQRLYNAMGLLARQDRNNYELQNDFFMENMKKLGPDVNSLVTNMGNEGSHVFRDFSLFALNSEKGTVLKTIDSVAVRNGMKSEDLIKAMKKNPMKRTDFEQNVCVELRRALESKAFPDGKVHAEQSNLNGKDVAEDNSLGTEHPNGDAVKQELNGLRQAEAEMDALIRDNDIFSQNFKKLQSQGLTNPQIYDWMVQQGGLTVEQLEPFAHYINANARVQGMQEATKQKIEETVSVFAQDWSYHGTLNGQAMNGEQALYVKDSNGRTLLVGSGDVAFDQTTGRAKEGSGDMLVCFDPNTNEMVYVKADEVTLFQNQPIDQFTAEYRQRLQMKNSEPYNQSAQEQAMLDAANPQPNKQEAPQDNTTKSEDSTTKEGDLTKDNTTLTKVYTTSGENNTTNEDLAPQEQPQQTRKFTDGTEVPMNTDSKGRPTPDYASMTPEQSAEILTEDFGENAEKVVDGQIQKAEKALKDAEKMKVDYTAEPNDIMEQEALKKKTVEAAKKQLDHAQNIKKAMTAKKVAETVERPVEPERAADGVAQEAGVVSPKVKERFEASKKIKGRRGSITLADGTKIRGTYYYGETSGLTTSHDPFNDFKQSEGFPVNEDGTSSNSRSYRDKESRLFTQKIGNDFNGLALKNVPVVQEGITLSGNGTVMGKKLAEQAGKDSKYYEDLEDNAEGFGWTTEQINGAGFKGIVYFVPDEKLPLNSKTFDLFNKKETKSESNTEQAVKNAKTLTSDEVGAIVAEIEGNGSLEAFFNNSKAINDLVKTLVDKGIIGQNEVAQMMDSPERLSAQGREYVKNLLLVSIFKPETIRMLGIDSTVKNKAINAIRSVMDNMKLGEFSLRDEIDQAVQLLYEARQGGNKVDTLLRTPSMFVEDAAKRYPSISQMMALALEGKVADFRDLLDEYNRIAAARNTGEGNVFGEAPTKPELIKEFLDFKKWQDYGTGHSENERGNDVSGVEEPKQEASGGNEPAEAGEGRVKSEDEDKPNSVGFTPKEIRDHQEKLGRAKEKYIKALSEAKSEKEIKAAEDEFEFTYKDHQNMTGVLDEASVADMWKNELESAKDSVKKDSKKLSADPMEALENAANAFHEEQKQKTEFKRNLEIGKARQEYEEAKKKGNTDEIKHAAGKLRNLLNEKYKAQGMGFEQRRKKIAEEIGKAEAEIIDKPWEQMDLEEREAVSSKNPLTESEINELTSEENKELIPAALAYLRGDKGNIINAISYFKIWNDVRNRHENVSGNSGTENGTQLDASDTTGGEGLGLGRGRESGRPDGPVDRGAGNEAAPGERNGREGDQNDTTLSAGEQGNKQGEGNSSGMGAVPAGSSDTNGGGSASGNGHVSGGSGRESSKRPADTNAGRKPTAKQGTTFPDSTAERLKQERADYEKKKKDFWDRWKKAGQGYAKIALTPFKKLNLTPEQIEMLPELFKMHLNGAVLKIKEGIYKFNEWKAAMLAEEGEELKMIGLSDDDIDRFIEDYWNTPYEMDGETHTIREWSSIYGNQQLKKKLKEPLEEKYKRQMEAEPIEVKVGNMKNIEETLPYLLPQQQEDVLKAETQFFGKEHTDREHAYGKGYLFTNGTGTGKTYTGLGIAKRLAKQGKGRILFITPSQKKVSDWIKDGKNLGLDIKDLDSWAKERGTTATTENGEGMVITTFANFGLNKKLLETEWDAVIYDECHRIMENKKGTETARSMQHYMVTNRDENHCFRRLQSINPEFQKMNGAAEKFNALRQKEIDRIKKEYKDSHPSATDKDVVNATLKSLPRELNNFAPADGMTFPKLGKAYQDFIKARDAYNKVEPKLKEQAKDSWKNTKTIFLSATPFNTRENLDYVEGYIFKYPETDERGMGGRTQFYLNHFGAAYKFRYHRLEQSISNPDAVAKQEVAFSDYLQNTLGTMSGRIIDSPYDYSRDFPTVAPDHAEDFNHAVQDTLKTKYLHDAYSKTIGDYNYGSALFETMKVSAAIDRIKQHLDLGRKVVIFHRRVESKEPLEAPFAYMLRVANEQIKMMKPGKERDEYIEECTEFRNKYADLLEWEKTLDYSMPREQIAKVFGEKNVLFFSGKESKKVKDKAVDTFNDDDSGKNIIVIQEASGKEGISLHDTTSKHQRVCITLALPQSPITALQIEGRIYRIGNMSNAIFEYPILGLNSEMMLFGEKFNNQVSTTENLALGSQARNLRDSFAKGILEHSGIVPVENQGVGGKEFDAATPSENDPFDNAVLDYYSNQKLNKNNREGSDYFPTPEPLGYKMVEWAGLGEGDSVLEPSAGHGAIARYVPKTNEMVSIEPSQSLFTKLQLMAGGLGRKFMNNTFENYALNNKHDVIVMNPPFGKAGALAIQHVDKAFKHLDEGGRIVAIIPRGSTDKKFDKWYNEQKNVAMRAEVNLPDILFQQAGTRVSCRVVVLDKISDAALRSKAGYPEKIDLSGHYDKIEDFFNDLRDIEMPDRIIDTNLKMQKKAKAAVKDIMEIKGVKNVSYGKTGIDVSLTGSWMNYGISFTGSDKPNYWRDKMANYYTKYDELQKLEYQENKQSVFDELKKLSCKLAGMTEDEMQRYIESKNNSSTHFRMELGKTFSDSKDNFDGVRDRAVEEKGIVMPNLNKESVNVVPVEKHSFKGNNEGAIENARKWAKENLVTTGKSELPTMRDGTPYTISKKAVDKYLSSSAVSKSDDLGVHLSVLPKLTDVIHESIEAEIHPDYNKDENENRSIENGYGDNILVHRLYGAVRLDGKTYRVKTTMQEFRGGEENKPHSYEVTKIELLEGSKTANESDSLPLSSATNNSENELLDTPGTAVLPDSSHLDMTPSNSISVAKLLNGVEKSYDSGKKLLEESKNLTDEETYFRNDNDSPVSISKDAPAVVKHVAKVAKATGGKVKMLQSVEEVTNAEAKARLENGEKVEGWYDERTGEVVLYMPNVHDSYTAEKTVWHEIVGHKGMRELFGNDNYDKFLDDIYFNLDKPEYADLKKLVMKELQYNPFDYRNAIEEAIARMAEDGHGEHGLWNNLKNKVANIFREIGYRVAPNTKDIKYLLWLAKNYSKHPESDGYFAIRRNALLYKLERDNTPSIVEKNGMFFDNDGKNHDYLLDLNHKDFEEATDGKVHFRTSPMAASKIEEYNRRLGTKLYAFKESTVDHMQSLQEAMEIISGEKNAWTDIPSAFNPLQAQNRIDSIVQQKAEEYDRKYTKPLDDSFKKVVSTMSGSDKDEQLRNAQLYMITKHGLERNRVFFVRDAIRDLMNDDVTKAKTLMKDWNDKQKDLADELEKGNIRFDEYLEQMDEWIRSNVDVNFVADEHDYSGFHGMQNIAKTSDPYDDKLAIDNVMSAESQMGSDLAKDFWTKKKAATDYVIDQEYYNGFIDNSDRDYLKGMFQWYVPLRKFDDTTAEDVYGYIGEKGDPSNFVGPVLAQAKGRSSLSDINVMAQISAMAKSSLINGGKNVVKQHFARFVSAYETGNTKDKIFVEVNPWLEKHVVDGNEVWEEATPQIPENATQQQISNILQNFEDTMQAKKATGDAKISRRNPNIGFKFQRAKDKSEHIVDVYIAGKKRSFVCQGNPRAAQALNGLVKDSGTRNVATRFDAKITRKIAQFNTSLNPDFMMSNMLRDLTFASANVTKEGFAYTKDFLKEYAGNIISIKNGKGSGNYLTMFRKYRDGKLDINNERERMFKEFMDNGGQTGFVQIKKLESLIDEYDNLIKKGSKDADGWFVKKIKEGGTFIETANEIIENVARYSTYCTSRKHGRSVGRSIYDAKEVSTNFNRHGSGDAIRKLKTSTDSNIDKIFRRSLGFFNSWMKNHTQFYNAGVQGANLFFKNYKSAWKTTAVSFGMLPLGLGIAQALINQFLINNEDEKDRNGVKDPYAELPEWKRRNNICIYTGHGNFKTIPIAIELRAFFGLGDIAAGYVVNDKLKSSTPIGYDILGQMAQLVPASDFLGHHSPSSSIKELGEDALLAVTPTTISPAMELAFNRDWTGRPFYRDYDYLDKAPRWKRAYDNTNDIYMSINKWANQGTNGIDSSNADMKGNETLDYLTAPYAWQHLIDSYTGGMGSTIGRTYKTLEAIGKGVVSGAKNEEGFSKGFSDEFEKFDKNQIPLYRVFNYTPKEGQDMQRTRSKWYNYSDELKQTEYNIKQLKTNTPDVLKNMENNAKKFNFTHGKEGKAYNIWKAADSYISKKKRQLNKVSNPDVIKSINEDINRKMQEAVNDLDKLN